MKKIFLLLSLLVISWSFSVNASATLINRGTDSLGNRLIYDTDLNVTWYDCTNLHVLADSWQDHANWAANLAVNLNGTVYDDWRLPNSITSNSTPSFSYNGSTTAGYNITSSELGYLFYLELGNKGAYDTSGNLQSGYGLINMGLFEHLLPVVYWSGTGEYPSSNSGYYYNFSMSTGGQGCSDSALPFYGIAIRQGDVAAVPEPPTIFLLVAGFIGALLVRKILISRMLGGHS